MEGEIKTSVKNLGGKSQSNWAGMSLNMHERSPLFSRNKKTETEEMGAQKMGQNIRLLLGGKLTLSIF